MSDEITYLLAIRDRRQLEAHREAFEKAGWTGELPVTKADAAYALKCAKKARAASARHPYERCVA